MAKNIFETNELDEKRTFSKMEIVRNRCGRNVKCATAFCNLDLTISIGYGVNSQKVPKFRIWVTHPAPRGQDDTTGTMHGNIPR